MYVTEFLVTALAQILHNSVSLLQQCCSSKELENTRKILISYQCINSTEFYQHIS